MVLAVDGACWPRGHVSMQLASHSRGASFVAVLLGDIYHSHGQKQDLKKPPAGYDSVKGYGDTETPIYMIYETMRTCPRYIVEFTGQVSTVRSVAR